MLDTIKTHIAFKTEDNSECTRFITNIKVITVSHTSNLNKRWIRFDYNTAIIRILLVAKETDIIV